MIGLLLGTRDVGRLSILDLYSNVFGYSGSPIVYPIGVKKDKYDPTKSDLVVDKVPKIGQEQLSYFKISSKDEEFEFPLGAIMLIESSNKIIRRYAQRSSGKGSIKEVWQDDDFKINIRAILQDSKFPEQQITSLTNICREKQTLKVTCPYLLIFGITNLVIDNYKFNEVQEKIQTIEIIAFSDYEADLLDDK